jgi:hypothetical protein
MKKYITNFLNAICGNKNLPVIGVIYGKDAERFLENINNPKKISSEERQRIRKSYEAIMSKAKL